MGNAQAMGPELDGRYFWLFVRFCVRFFPFVCSLFERRRRSRLRPWPLTRPRTKPRSRILMFVPVFYKNSTSANFRFERFGFGFGWLDSFTVSGVWVRKYGFDAFGRENMDLARLGAKISIWGVWICTGVTLLHNLVDANKMNTATYQRTELNK